MFIRFMVIICSKQVIVYFIRDSKGIAGKYIEFGNDERLPSFFQTGDNGQCEGSVDMIGI